MHIVAQSCPTLWDPMDCLLPGSSVHGIAPKRILGWVAIAYFRGFSGPRDKTHVSCGSCRFFIVKPPGKPWSLINYLLIHIYVKMHLIPLLSPLTCDLFRKTVRDRMRWWRKAGQLKLEGRRGWRVTGLGPPRFSGFQPLCKFCMRDSSFFCSSVRERAHLWTLPEHFPHITYQQKVFISLF